MKMSRNKGITLIALVITIIVMLILVAVTVNMAINGGLFSYASKASEGTKEAMTEEKLKLSIYSAYIEGNGILNYEKLVSALKKEFEEGNYEITPDDSNAESWTITVGKTEVELKNEKYVAPTAVYAYKATRTGETEADTLVLCSKIITETAGYSNLDVYKNSEGHEYDISNSHSEIEWYDEDNLFIKYIDIIDEIAPTNCEYFFSNCLNLEEIKNISNLKTNNAVSMERMFNSCESLTNLDLSGFDTSNVENMKWMFTACESLKSVNLSSFNTEKVTNMESMFDYCMSLGNLDLSNFNTKNVTNMNAMFNSCVLLQTIKLSSKFNTEKVEDMADMFKGCFLLKGINLSSFNTENVTDMSEMFRGCYEINSLDLTSFNTKKVENVKWMFRDTGKLKEILVGNDWDISGAANTDYMFYNCGTNSVTKNSNI